MPLRWMNTSYCQHGLKYYSDFTRFMHLKHTSWSLPSFWFQECWNLFINDKHYCSS